jgi:alpha-tubulin suppressor-like RCC1 family protein
VSMTFAIVAPSVFDSATNQHTCALNGLGEVYCWGSSDGGGLGQDQPIGGNCSVPATSSTETCARPLFVSGPPPLSTVVSGGNFSCGLAVEGGGIWCWGGTRNATPGQLDASGLSTMVAGGRHLCGINADRQAYCWGDGVDGKLGIGIDHGSPAYPALVSGSLSWVQLSAGMLNTCGVTSDNYIYCWGSNSSKQLGDPDFTSTAWEPHKVPIGSTLFRTVTVGNEHVCALSTSDVAYCWGRNVEGQLGDGTTSSPRTSPAVVSGAPKFGSISAGRDHTCAVAGDGTGYCWGANDVGQLGDGTTTRSTVPVKVAAPNGLPFASITAADGYTCGLTTNNAVYCWGSNGHSQLGNGTNVDSRVPVLISPP